MVLQFCTEPMAANSQRTMSGCKNLLIKLFSLKAMMATATFGTWVSDAVVAGVAAKRWRKVLTH